MKASHIAKTNDKPIRCLLCKHYLGGAATEWAMCSIHQCNVSASGSCSKATEKPEYKKCKTCPHCKGLVINDNCMKCGKGLQKHGGVECKYV